MKIKKEDYNILKKSMTDDGMWFCNVCETYFILRNNDDGYFNQRVCPCCGVCSDCLEPVEVVDTAD